MPSLDELPEGDPAGALEQFAVIKLNGGLATTMGLRSPKSLLEAREGRTFLDIIIGQTLALRRRFGVRLPLELMDSEATRDETLAALAKHPELSSDGIPPDFMQSMIPKLDAESLRAGELARPAVAGMEPSRSRRHLRRAAAVGHAGDAARAGLSVRDDLQLRQPRRDAGPADRRVRRRRGDPVPDGGVRGDRGRPQGRPHRPPPRRRTARPARGRADARRRPGVVSRLPPLALLQLEHAVGRSERARRAARAVRRRARTAADHQPQDRGSRATRARRP